MVRRDGTSLCSRLQKPVLGTYFVPGSRGPGTTEVLSLNSGSSLPHSRTRQKCWPQAMRLSVDMGPRAGKYG